MSDVLSHEELVRITGYTQHAKQLEELHRNGFYRARRSRITGHVILERPHYEAVCQGAQQQKDAPRPRLHKPAIGVA